MTSKRKIPGVLGGMGPAATVDFMARVIALTPADTDQDHIRMLVDHDPTVPSRLDAILGDGEDPGPAIAAMARRLEAGGADFLVIPCNTAYAYAEYVTAAVSIPLLSIIDETIAALPERCSCVGLLATEGCLETGVYQQAFAAAGVGFVVPEGDDMRELMGLVHAIKAGDTGAAVSDVMRALADGLVARGADAIVAGCTEVPLVLDDTMLGVPFISSTDVLAAATVKRARPE